MRNTTHVVMGMRNVGDSSDTGQFFEGAFKDSLLWMIQRLGAISMKHCFTIVIARNMDDCRKKLTGQAPTRSNNKEDKDEQLRDLLDSVLLNVDDNDDDAAEGTDNRFYSQTDTTESNETMTRDPRDNYTPPHLR